MRSEHFYEKINSYIRTHLSMVWILGIISKWLSIFKKILHDFTKMANIYEIIMIFLTVKEMLFKKLLINSKYHKIKLHVFS